MRTRAFLIATACLFAGSSAWAAWPSDPQMMVMSGGGLLVGVIMFVFGFLSFRHKRLIENLPTSKMRSMAIGLVEIKGKVVDWNCLRAPFSGTPCAYYQYLVEEYRSSGKNSRWVTVRKGSSDGCPFYIEDETGRALVHPQEVKADVAVDYTLRVSAFAEVPSDINTFLSALGFSCSGFLGFNKTLRFTERRLEPGAEIYVLGTCQTNDRVVSQAYLRSLKDAIGGEAVIKPSAGYVRSLGGGFVAGNPEMALVFPVGKPLEPPASEDRVFVGRAKGSPFVFSDKSERDLAKGLGWAAFLGVFGGIGIISSMTYWLLR